MPLADLTSSNPTLVVDLVAAGVAAIEHGAHTEAVAEVCRSFRPGRHRRTQIGGKDGVAFVDDSKATNPHAALASIASFPSVVLIAGGVAKGLDITPLARAGNVRHVVAIGESAPALIGAAGPGRATRADSMVEAVEVAARMARPGDTVLLAPGCASFDMFESYGARGAAFCDAVSSLIKGGSG